MTSCTHSPTSWQRFPEVAGSLEVKLVANKVLQQKPLSDCFALVAGCLYFSMHTNTNY